MSVSIKYLGRWGNSIFQYCCARLFSEENKLSLETKFPSDQIFEVSPYGGGRNIQEPVRTLNDFDGVLDLPYPPGNYVFQGFFQKASWYLSRKDRIVSFMKPRPTPFKRNSEDIAIHLRLGDFKAMKWCLHPEWYLSILRRESFGRLYIFTDERDQDYLRAFDRYRYEVVFGKPEEDWQFLRSFDRVALSMSTFAWWAAFFGQAKKMYLVKNYPFGAGLSDLPGATLIDGCLLHEGA